MIGPWKIKYKLATDIKIITVSLLALTMIDRATKWPEFSLAQNASAIHILILFDKVWLSRYSRPFQVVHVNGNEFIGKEFLEILSSYAIESKPTSVKNPQANALIEMTHLSMGDKLRTIVFEGEYWYSDLDREL